MDAFPAPTMAFYRDASLKQSIKVGTAVVVVIDNDDDDADDTLSKKVGWCAHLCSHQTNKL